MKIKLNGLNINRYEIICETDSEDAAKAALALSRYIKRLSSGYGSEKPYGKIIISHGSDNSSDGIRLMLKGKKLYIRGDSSRSVHYAVYEFLDRYLGYRFYSYEDEKNVLEGDIDIKPFEYVFKPKFTFRYNYNFGCFGEEISYKQKSDMFMGRRADKNVSPYNFVDNKWGHTYFDYVSPEEYFESHPEFFSMNDKGERINNGQLCLSDKNVREIALKKMLAKLKEQPECEFIAFSQNDNDKYCRCENCKKYYRRYGSLSATNISAVNYFAKEIKKAYPATNVITFAYQYTEAPPRNMKIEKNVTIFQALMNECKEHLLTDKHCRFNPKMLKCLAGWAELTENVFLWVYITGFLNYLLGIPKNIRFIYQNFQIYKRYNVKGIMWQNAGDTVGDFSDLWGYLVSLLNWNTDLSYTEYYDRIVEYLKTHYGNAWRYIFEYINVKANQPASFACFNPYPTAEMIAPYEKLPDGEYDESYINIASDLLCKAEALAENDYFSTNVKKCRISLDWYVLEVTRKTYTSENISQYAAKAKDLYLRIKELNDTVLGEGKRLAPEGEINFNESPQNWLQ